MLKSIFVPVGYVARRGLFVNQKPMFLSGTLPTGAFFYEKYNFPKKNDKFDSKLYFSDSKMVPFDPE